MLSCAMLRHVALVRTAVLEEGSASIIRVTRIGEQIYVFSKGTLRPIMYSETLISCSRMCILGSIVQFLWSLNRPYFI
jgi:hypothetical protein